jgi:hypothetical protein
MLIYLFDITKLYIVQWVAIHGSYVASTLNAVCWSYVSLRHTHQNDDITVIRLREIVCYMLPPKMTSLTLKGQLEASVPPVDEVRGYLPTRRSPDISI